MSSNPMPQHIGRYEILGELGKGAMGIVYKAQDPTIGRMVALKTMRLDAHGMEAGEMLARFKNEARAAGILNHSNIVTIYDAGEHEGLFYIAMEFIEGTTLQKTLNEEGIVPIEQVIDFARQICSGLDYAHSHKIIHRDIKPANIMMEADGRLKIMDFGIAKGEGAGLTSAGQVLGTPNYMSPEQVKGRPLDGRSDLWSFGVILYEMVTGEKPFSGQNVTTIIYKIVNEEPIAPKELDSSIHPGLSAVIQRALAKNPDKRYQKGADLVHHLANHRSLDMDTAAVPAQASGSHAAVSAAVTKPATEPKPAAPAIPATASAPAKTGAGAAAAPQRAPAPVAKSPQAATHGEASETLVAGSHAYVAPVTAKKSPAAVAQGMASRLTPNQWLMAAAGVLLVVIVAIAIGIRHQTAAPTAPSPTASVPATVETPAQPVPATPSPGTPETSPQPVAETPTEAPKPKARAPKQAAPVAAAPVPEAAPAAPANGTLHLVTNPPGAKVEIDGWSEASWVTPFDSPSLSGGKHKIVFTKPGFAPQTQIVDVWPGKQAIIASTLNAAVAQSRLEITTDPPGALILLDGKETGKQTPANLEVAPGDHNVTLHKLGFKDVSLAANVKAGETAHVSQPLKAGAGGGANPFGKIFGGGAPEGMGNLQVKTKPKGAVVKVNGEQAPKTTPFKLPLDPGTYTVTVLMDGYQPVTKGVAVEKGKTTNVDLELQK